jgi:hypothetical protein
MPIEFLGVAPWVAVSAGVSWVAQAWIYRVKRADDKVTAQHETDDRLIMHRDELTLQIIRTGREELTSARIEVDDLRDEVRKLRVMEGHFFHFHQSLDHLEALLTASTPEERKLAERNAQAFLARMRRLNAARGTLANEAQRSASEVSLIERSEKDSGNAD